jgi:hypothetical protein
MNRHSKRSALLATVLLVGGLAVPALGQAAPAGDAAPLTDAEIEQLVSPIALYPDSLMTQILMASTYPLEVVTAQRYAQKNKNLSGDALAKDLEKQSWDPSVKSLVNFPTVLDMLNTNLEATTKLGDTFLADQKRVLDAVQRLRSKAQAQGNLKTTAEQKVVMEQQGAAQVIVIAPAKPEVIYVPTYNPTVVYGSWPYPAYPPYYYRPPGAALVSGAIGFGVGVACGAAWGYAWGNCNWGHSDVNINVNQNANFNKNIDRSKYQTQINSLDRSGSGSGTWQHDPAHRSGVAYRDNTTAQKFGGVSDKQAAQSRDAFRGRTQTGQAGAGGAGNLGGAGAQPRPAAGGVAAGDRGSAGAGGATSANRTSDGGAFSGLGGGGGAARSSSAQGAASRSTGGGAARRR